MDTEDVLARLRHGLSAQIEEIGAEVFDMTLKRESRGLVLRLTADKKNGSISVEECAALNKGISDIIDRDNLIEERYIIEVASPGLDRPFKSRRDFERALGKEAELNLFSPLGGKHFIIGIIKEAGDASAVVEDKDKNVLTVPYNIISRARLKISF